VLGRRRRGRPPAVKLLPVQVRDESRTQPAESSSATLARPASEGRIEITLADGVRIAISGTVLAEQLHQILAVLRR
jgi:hypothetical protein